MSDTPDRSFSINQSQLPQSNVAACNQVGRDLNQTVNVYAGVPLTETLQQLLYHHESATIFANRLQGFVGREAEIADIRQRIAQVMPTGGYVTITAQAGEGKSSVIARMVSQDGPDQTAFHFIALTPGREYQLSLLRPIVARLILKHDLPTTYFPGESYPAMRDYFHSVLRQLSERGVQEVIYIDGLDQLEPESGGLRDLSFLPSSPPPGIVLVLGTRPDDTLQPLDGKKVQVEYRLPHLSFPDFHHLLTQRGVVTPAAHQLYTALQGNAFYLALVVQELKAGPIDDLDTFVQRISDNPDNLFGLTIERLQRDDAQWEQVLERVLGLLLDAQEPLDRATIRGLLGVSDVRLRRGLGQLGGLVAQDANGRYFLYHLKVRDYLAEDEQDVNKPYVVSQEQIVAWHSTLAQWCVRDAQDSERIWEDTTGPEQTRRWYARHHYVTHLAKGAQWDALSQVIDDGIYGRHKRRFDLSTQLYALDLDRARDMAVQKDDLIRLWRWSLLRVSLTSQIDSWPDALFLALVHLGRGSEALSRVELLSDSSRKVAILGQLAPLFDVATAQRIWDRALSITAAIADVGTRARTLSALATAQAQSGHPDADVTLALAATVTTAIVDDEMRARTLSALAVAQANAELWVEAQTTTAAITDDTVRASTLTNLAVVQSEVEHPDAAATFALATITAITITSTKARACTLSALATAQTQANHADAATTFALAATATTAISTKFVRAKGLRALAAAQAQAKLWAEAQITASTITDNKERAWAFHALAVAQAQAELLTEAQLTATAITDDTVRADALSVVAAIQAQVQHPDTATTFALATIAVSIDDRERISTLITLAQAMAQIGHPNAPGTFAMAVAAATGNVGDERRFISLRDLVIALAQTGLWAEAQSILAAITHDRKRAIILGALAAVQAQAGLWTEFQITIASITDSDDHASALSWLAAAQAQAGLWTESQSTIASITNVAARTRALCVLAAVRFQAGYSDATATFALVADAITAIADDNERNGALSSLASAQAQAGLWAEAQATTAAIQRNGDRFNALSALATAQAQAGLLDEAQTTAAAIPPIWQRFRAFRALAAAQAQAGLWVDVRTTVAAIPLAWAWERASALHDLHVCLLQAGHTAVIRCGIGNVWRSSTTRDTLLMLAKIAHPLIAHDPDLGREMVAAFAWVDDQLREG